MKTRWRWRWPAWCAALAGALAGGAAPAATVRMGFGDNLPPYILVERDGGIEVEMVREALALRGHTLRADYLPMGRLPLAYRSGRVDAIMMDVGEDMAGRGHYAEPPVLYDNVFYTLRARKLRIERPEQLRGRSIMAFVGAAKRYPDWLGALSRSPDYAERNNQAAQPLLLALGRYDVVLSDRTIFQYYVWQGRKRDPAFVMPAVDEHAFTRADPRDYRPVFRDAAIRDDFNAGLAQLRKSGRYRAIYAKYLGD